MPSRRRTLAGAGLATASLIGGYAASGQSTTTTLDWPMERYDPAGTGYNPDARGPTDDPEVTWTGDIEGSGGFTFNQPIIVDGTVYAGNDELLALDAATGDRRFSYGSYGGPARSSPACAAASIYRTKTLAVSSPGGIVGLNADGGLSLFGLQIGEKRWLGPGKAPGTSPFGSSKAPSPVAVEDTVYAAAPGTGDIVALEADNGHERWRRTIRHEDGYDATLSRPAVRDGTVFVTGWPQQVRAFDAETGRERWARTHDEQLVRPPTATDGGVLVPTRSGVTMYEADDGDVRWARALDGNATEGAAAVAEDRAFVADGLQSLYALDLETGEDEWSTSFSHEVTPVVADGVVYITMATTLVTFDAETGERRFTYEGDVYFSPPAVGDGTLYVVDGDRILALEESA